MANNIRMEISLDGKDALKTLTALQNGFEKTSKTTERVTKTTSTFASVLKANLVSLVSVNFAGFITSQVRESFNAFADFEKGLINVAKTANLTEEETGRLASNIEDLAKVIPASTDELLDIATAAGQLGVKGTANITLFAETIAKLGRVSNVSGEDAATSLVRILNVTRENISEVDTFASVIVSLGNNFAATESEIIAVTNEVARATAQFGVSSGEAASLAAVLRSLGIRAEEAGGVFSKTFIAINEAISSGGARLKDLERITGLTGDEIRQQFGENATKFFRNFLAGLNDLPPTFKTVTQALSSLGIEGIRVSKVIPVLASNVSEVDRSLGLLGSELKDTVALEEEFEKATKTTVSQTQLLSNAIDQAQRNLGERLAGAFKEVTPLLADFISKIGEDRESAFIKDTDDVKVLAKELAILQRQLAAVNADGKVSFFEKDPAKIAQEIDLINKKITELNTDQATTAIKDLEFQISEISKTAGDPVLQSVLYGSPEQAKQLEDQLKVQLENAKNLQAVASNELLEKKQEDINKEVELEAERFNLLNALREEQKAFEVEQGEISKIEKELEGQAEFERLSTALGRETALRELARIKDLDSEKKRQVALKKLNDKAREAEKIGILGLRKFENFTLQQKVEAQRQALSTIATLSQSSNSALFALGKASSLALAGINVAEGVTKTLAAYPSPLNFALAGAVAAAGAVQVARIAGAKPPSAGSFQDGGLITGPSQVGDRLTAQVNAGETILNRRQSERVFSAIDNNQLGSGGTTVNINNPVLLEDGAINEVIDKINDAIEFGNAELRV